MAKNKEYELAIKIAGEIDKSFTESTGLTKKELRKIAKEAAFTSSGMKASFDDGIKSLEKGFGSIEKTAKKVFDATAKAAAVAGTAISGAVAASIAVGAPFEEQMSTVRAISGATNAEMEILNKKAKEMGATTKFTATESGQAMEYMAMAGWKAEQMISGIDGIMNLAAASGEELALVSDIVTDAMTAMKIPVEGTTKALGKDGLTHEVQNATHFADVLAAAAANSNTNVSMLGESFKHSAPLAGAYGFELEDTALALSLMANSGIKASQSGTAFRKILTQLSADFKVAQKDGTDFHVATVNSDGSMRSLKEILDDTREAFTGMSAAQKEAMQNDISASATELDIALTKENGTLKTQAELYDEITAAVNNLTEAGQVQEAEAIAGKTAMAGLLAIINSSEEDYDKLYDSIMSCNGAAEEMAKIRLDNLRGDYTIFTSGTEGLGVEAYEGMSGLFRSIVQAATGEVNKMTRQLQITNAIPRFVDELQGKIPTAIRHMKAFSHSWHEFAEPLLKLGGWLLKNSSTVISGIVGIGGALATFRAVQGISNATKALKTFSLVLANPFALGILALTAAAGALVAFKTKVALTEKEMKRQNLAEHFGNITLSLSELKEIAGEIIRTDSLGKVHEAMTAFEDLDGIKNNIEDSVKTLKKLNWKVSIGMDLSTDDLQTYENSVNQFIEDNLGAALQGQYGMSLVLDSLTNDDASGKKIRESFSNFYTNSYQELSDMGEELGRVMADALQDGMLDIDEVAAIAEMQQKMSKVTNALTMNNFDAKMEVLQLKYSGGELDADSFMNLQAEINAQLEAAISGLDESLEFAIAGAKVRLNEGDIAVDEYEEMIQQFKENHLNQVGEIELKAASFQLNTLMEQYEDELSEVLPELTSVLENGIGNAMEGISIGENGALAWSTVIQELTKMNGLDKVTQNAIEDLFELMKPTMEQMERHTNRYVAIGAEIPEAIREGMTDMAAIGALVGDVDSMWILVGDYIGNSDEYSTMLKSLEKTGTGIPPQIADAMEKNKKPLSDASKKLQGYMKKSLEDEFSRKIDLTIPLSITATIPEGLRIPSMNTSVTVDSIPTIGAFATGGIITSPTLATFAEEGPEAAIPLDGSANAINLWKLTGELLGVYKGTEYSGFDTPDSLESMYTRLVDGGTVVNNETDNFETRMEFHHNPTYVFYGAAPNKNDLQEASRMSQEEFNQMMEEWTRNKERTSLRR